MIDITNAEHFLKTDLISNLNLLKSDTKPLWGTMTAQHAVEHLSLINNLILGENELPLMVTEEIAIKSRRWTFDYKNPFPKDMRRPFLPENPAPYIYGSLEEAIAAFLDELNRIYAYFEAHPNHTKGHPVFGQLNRDEWYFFIAFHSWHHLSQYGIMPEIPDNRPVKN